MAEVKERNTEERATRMAERIWRETIDDSKLDIKKIRAICLFYLISERDQAVASHAPATAPPDYPAILERERTVVAEGITNIKKAISNREWLTEGRGSYEWNDDRWHGEFKAAIDEIREAMKPLEKIAEDLKYCPQKWDEVQKARAVPIESDGPLFRTDSPAPSAPATGKKNPFPPACRHGVALTTTCMDCSIPTITQSGASAAPGAREPHDGWLNAWLYQHGAPEESEFYRFAWHSKIRKMAGDWSDFRIERLKAERDQLQSMYRAKDIIAAKMLERAESAERTVSELRARMAVALKTDEGKAEE